MSSPERKNRTFWSKHREELDRIGWTGKHIFSDSEEDAQDTASETEASDGNSSDLTLPSVQPRANTWDRDYQEDYEDHYYLDDRESDGQGSRDEYYQHIFWDEYWSCVQYANDHDHDHDSANSHDDNDDGDGDWQHITTPTAAIQEIYEDGFVLGYILGFVTLITAEVGVFCFSRRLYD